METAQKKWLIEFHYVPTFHFLIWQHFTSRFGSDLLPDLAAFYFPIWRGFTSWFGKVLYH
jgi:hypothetical protein